MSSDEIRTGAGAAHVTVPGLGHCQFQAVGYGAQIVADMSLASADTMRENCCTYLRNNPGDLFLFACSDRYPHYSYKMPWRRHAMPQLVQQPHFKSYRNCVTIGPIKS